MILQRFGKPGVLIIGLYCIIGTIVFWEIHQDDRLGRTRRKWSANASLYPCDKIHIGPWNEHSIYNYIIYNTLQSAGFDECYCLGEGENSINAYHQGSRQQTHKFK